MRRLIAMVKEELVRFQCFALINTSMKVVDISKHREKRQQSVDAESAKQAADAIFQMKHKITVSVNESIDALMEAGMSEDKAMLVVMTYLSDLVMGHDLS